MVRRIHCGINTDPKNRELGDGNPSVQDIRDLGATWVRFVFKDPHEGPQPTSFGDYDQLVQDLHQAGINILMVLNNETYPNWPEYGTSRDNEQEWERYREKFGARCRQIAEHYGSQVQAYEIWNEPDHPPKPGYNPYVRAEAFGPLLKAACGEIKAVSDATVVLGGLAWGQPPYLQEVQDSTNGVLHADAVGVHPYFRRPTQDWRPPDHPADAPWGAGIITDLIEDYHDIAQKPIWITEVGINVSSISARADFLRLTFEALNAEEIASIAPYVFWYCWSYAMGQEFGLVGRDGEKTEVYDEFRAFATVGMPIVEPAEVRLFAQLLERAEEEQSIQFNPNASLQSRIFADGFVPNSGEFSLPFGSVAYIAQRAEHLESGEVRVYYVQKDLWDLVWFLTRPSEAEVGPTAIDRPSEHFSERKGEKVRYIIVHSTDSPVGVAAENTLDYLVGPNDREVSAHEVVMPGGKVHRLVPDELAAHHTESESVQFPDGTPWQRANEATWGIESFQICGRAVGQEVLEATIDRVVAACKRLELDYTRVLGHREVDPSRKNDPVGVDMDEFRAAVADSLLRDALLAAGEENQVMQFNPDAALQQAIFADGFVPNSGEFELPFDSDTYLAQRAEHLETGDVRVYYVKKPEWDNVQRIERA